MSKKRLTTKERTQQRTKKVRDLFTNSLDTHLRVMTGTITKESTWLDDVCRVGKVLKASLNGDDSMEDSRLALDSKYRYFKQTSEK